MQPGRAGRARRLPRYCVNEMSSVCQQSESIGADVSGVGAASLSGDHPGDPDLPGRFLGSFFGVVYWVSLLNTLNAPILVLTGLELPFSIFTMKGFFDAMPWDIEMSAVADGATRRQAFWMVLLPQLCADKIEQQGRAEELDMRPEILHAAETGLAVRVTEVEAMGRETLCGAASPLGFLRFLEPAAPPRFREGRGLRLAFAPGDMLVFDQAGRRTAVQARLEARADA